MKREIEFRLWDKKRGEMINLRPAELSNVQGAHIALAFEEYGHTRSDEFERIEDYEVMQFTGLKDKQGKEIYESSVLNKKTTFENNMADKRFQLTTQINVGFENGCFIDKNSGQTLFDAIRTVSSYSQKVWTDYEIIGNELENPELI